MAYINSLAREINVKIAWLTPDRALRQVEALYQSLHPDLRRDLQRLQLESGAVLSFSFCPKALGSIRGHALRLHVYGGALGDAADRALLAKGADAIIVVDDADLTGVTHGDEPVVRGASADPPHAMLKEATKAVLMALKKGATTPAAAGPPAAAPAPHPLERRVGPYPVLLPEWCAQAEVVEKPPLYRLDGVHANGVSLTLAVWVEQGSADAVERALDDMAVGWQAQATERVPLPLEGVHFRGILSRCIPRDPSLRLVETYAGQCGPDLLAFTILHGPGDGDQASIQRLFYALVASAIVRAVSENPSRYRAEGTPTGAG